MLQEDDTAMSVEQPGSFAASESLFGALQPALRSRRATRVENRSLGALTLWPAEGVYLADEAVDMASLVRLCGEPAEAYQLRRARTEPPGADAPQPARPLEELLWTIGFAASRGRLIDALEPTDLMELTHWPNLTRVPLQERGLRLATLFCRYPSSIPLAARLTGAERSEVHQFLSAAWCAGIARAVNRAESSPEDAPTERPGSLVDLLLRHLWG